MWGLGCCFYEILLYACEGGKRQASPILFSNQANFSSFSQIELIREKLGLSLGSDSTDTVNETLAGLLPHSKGSRELARILTNLLSFNPSGRLSARDLLKDRIFDPIRNS